MVLKVCPDPRTQALRQRRHWLIAASTIDWTKRPLSLIRRISSSLTLAIVIIINNNFRVSNIRVSNRTLIYNACPEAALTFIDSFILTISIAPLQVLYHPEALPT